MTPDNLRERDITVLRCIRDGKNDVFEIRKATTLSNREVNYAITKLEQQELIEVFRPDGRIEREVDGQPKEFKAPKHATIIEHGLMTLKETDFDDERVQDMSRGELVKRVRELEERMDEMERGFESFRQQVLEEIE